MMATANLFLLCVTVLLLYLCIFSMPQTTREQPAQARDILFGDPFDIWRVMKVPEREAAQVIRRAARLGYKELAHLYDQAGSVYIHFQLCPPRRVSA